jgi:hypothetical protein
MTFAHVLVPLDGSTLSEAVVPVAMLLGRTEGAWLTIPPLI